MVVALYGVSRMENRGDMLLSILYDYLTATATATATATGTATATATDADADADAASIVVLVHGRRIELDLESLRTHPDTATR